MEEEKTLEISKCCGARASWNFSFKSCDKCGKRFEPLEPVEEIPQFKGTLEQLNKLTNTKG